MKKKIVSTMLCVAMVSTMLAGCGGGSDNGGASQAPAADSSTTEAPAADAGEAAAPAAGGGSVYWLNFKPESDEAMSVS